MLRSEKMLEIRKQILAVEKILNSQDEISFVDSEITRPFFDKLVEVSDELREEYAELKREEESEVH